MGMFLFRCAGRLSRFGVLERRMKTRMRGGIWFGGLLALALLGAGAGWGAEVRFTDQGLVLDGGASGSFCLKYPALLDAAQNPIPPASVVTKGNTATLSFPQGMSLTASREGAAVTLHFTGVTETARGFRMEMVLPGEFKDGGKFQVQDEAVKPFPKEFWGEQFVFKGNPKPFTLTAPQGARFTLAMPYGWQQLQDGRKWNAANFDYLFSTAMPSGAGNEAWFTFKAWSGGLEQEPPAPKAEVAKAAPPKPPPGPKFALNLTQEGLAIDAGSDGQFTLTYPVLVGARWDDVRKPVERKVTGHTATLRFDGDARIDVTLQPAEGTLTLTPVNVPSGVKSLRQTMLIDFSYVGGGAWKIGDRQETPFPAQKPAQPHIHQGSAETLLLRNPAGATVTLSVPSGSYQELTDNREWGWKIFAWHFDAPCASGAGPLRVKIASRSASGPAVKLVDRFGQSTRSEFAGKVKSEDELKQDVPAEAAWLASLQPPTFDTFGGLPGSREKYGLRRTGFFHVEKKDARWMLVDPEGNLFFHLGVCALNPSDDYTYFAGRESVYEWLPARDSEFKTAFHPDGFWGPNVLSFHLANSIRKFRGPYVNADYTARMIARLRQWGFNSAGAFGAGDAGTRQRLNFPHVAHLPLSTWEGFPDVPGTHGVFDPFSDKLRARCNQLFAEKLPAQAGDPLIIGYFLGNEPLWEEIPAAVTALDATHPCKRRLAQMLEEQYKSPEAFNRAWETTLPSFAEVAARGLPVKTQAAKDDLRKFTGLFLDAYFRLVTEAFHHADTNHLLIGNRFQPGTINNETVCRLSGQYLDVVSFNYYTYGLDRDLLARVHGWIGDRPMFFSEFYFSSPNDSGLSGGGKDVSSQRERGLAYRQYAEQAAALGYVVGLEWFTLVDQATTGRFFEKYTGEAANTGLIAVTDRPWRIMLGEMMTANYDIYKVFLGEKTPFHFADPRFEPAPKKTAPGP